MWTYIIRRLLILIPTLFGVTVVAFLVMQCAPGDPLASAGHGGAMNQNQDRTKYLLQRRDLDLDKPGLINLRYYAGRTESYRQGVEYVADIWSKPVKDLQNRLDKMLAEKEAQGELNEKDQKFFDFLASLGITDFTKVFEDKDKHEMLAQTIGGSSRSNLSNNKQGGYLRKWCEDAIHHGTPHAVAILADPKRSDAVRLGALRAVTKMVPEPAKPTYSKKRKEAETENILKVWELWYLHSLASGKLPPLDCKRYAKVKKRFDAILNAADDNDATTLSPGSADAIARDRVKWGMNFAYFNPKTQELFESGDAAVFYDVLTAKGSTLRQHDAATIALKTNVGMPLRFDLAAKDQEALTPAKDAKKDADPAALATARKNLNSITKNWQLHLATHPDLSP